jgi:hypothetical protein
MLMQKQLGRTSEQMDTKKNTVVGDARVTMKDSAFFPDIVEVSRSSAFHRHRHQKRMMSPTRVSSHHGLLFASCFLTRFSSLFFLSVPS